MTFKVMLYFMKKLCLYILVFISSFDKVDLTKEYIEENGILYKKVTLNDLEVIL